MPYNHPFFNRYLGRVTGEAYNFLQMSAQSIAHCPVLIVEDDADLREMMAQLLSVEGYHAISVANGREALEYLRSGAPADLILLDLMMPVMDGWEFRRQQQADPVLASVPVVVLSALDPSRSMDVRADAVLKKPVDFNRLLQLVRSYCQ